METLGALPRAALGAPISHSEQGDPRDRLALAEEALQVAYAAYILAKREHTRALSAVVRARLQEPAPAAVETPRLKIRSA